MTISDLPSLVPGPSAPGVPIVTLTVNPALDVSAATPRVISEHKLRCGPSRLDPGGGGVNVARVIHRLGGQVIAIYAVGGPTGGMYRQLLEAESLPTLSVPIGGTTRESFTVDETSSGEQFRFVLQGPELTEPEWQACLRALERSVPRGGYVVASGSLPPGVPADFYARAARIAHANDARCVVDASGDALAAALDEGVFLVKPSRRELGELIGQSLDTPTAQVDAAQELVARGASQLVALTLGGSGAVLASADDVLRLATPIVKVRSTVGAGDSFVGAFVLRMSQGRTLADSFCAAVAAGSATAMTPGTELCHAVDVDRLEAELTAQPASQRS